MSSTRGPGTEAALAAELQTVFNTFIGSVTLCLSSARLHLILCMVRHSTAPDLEDFPILPPPGPCTHGSVPRKRSTRRWDSHQHLG